MKKEERENTSLRERREVEMYGELEWLKVQRLRGQGYGYKPTARLLNMDWPTVKKLTFLTEPPRAKPRRHARGVQSWINIS